VAVVPQDMVLLNDAILQNIRSDEQPREHGCEHLLGQLSDISVSKSSVAVVPQDMVLFNDTVLQNIR
jgi:ABC-type transport system involved in Fe-S cluster assembly fused permease/ATPase subunit